MTGVTVNPTLGTKMAVLMSLGFLAMALLFGFWAASHFDLAFLPLTFSSFVLLRLDTRLIFNTAQVGFAIWDMDGWMGGWITSGAKQQSLGLQRRRNNARQGYKSRQQA